MGLTVIEQQQQQQQSGGGDSDKKKKQYQQQQQQRRSARRIKPNSSSPPLNSNASIELAGQHTSPINQNSYILRSGSSSKHQSPNKVFNVGISSPPTMHLDEQAAPANPGIRILSKSSAMPFPSEESLGKDEPDFVPLVNGLSKQKCFESHWSMDAVNEALQRGEVFQAQLRVNAFNRVEAYCTIEGVPTDILICGFPRQNRAVEGDVVAVKVDPPHLWSRMRGSAGGNVSSPSEDQDASVATDVNYDRFKGKHTVDSGSGFIPSTNSGYTNGVCDMNGNSSGRIYDQEVAARGDFIHANGRSYSGSNPLGETCCPGRSEVLNSVERLSQLVVSMPSKRPTGSVVAIIDPSSRRHMVVGFLCAKGWFNHKEGFVKLNRKDTNSLPHSTCDYIHLAPSDPKLPKMIIPVRSLPFDIKKRLGDGDPSIETELVSARIVGWAEDSSLPQASVVRSFGRGGEVESRIAAILYEYGVNLSEFSAESLLCLPGDSWQVPLAELDCRRDIRNLCVFTIDPSTATDLDDALSVESLSNGTYRIGVHIADVSYFVQPDTALDKEAEARSTSVYMVKSKISTLPGLISENLGSLIPGVDRLTFSIFWDLDMSGNILDRWVGRTVIRSCCKLSYEHAQDMIEGRVNVDSLSTCETGFPQLYGDFGWQDIFQSVRRLHEISKALKEHRFSSGALRLDNAKVVFLLDEFGEPYDCKHWVAKDANSLVEELMLLANRTAAEIIFRAFPDCALLRRHPEPNMRKLKEFEVFCRKHGLQIDVSSSGSLHRSLVKIREKLKDDSVFYDILINYATKPMQLAKYFCSGDGTVGKDDWGHYALAVPLYTHFTSPLRRYPDIVVHRTLTAVIEAEQEHLKYLRKHNKLNLAGEGRCLTGMNPSEQVSQPVETLKALSSAAVKYRLPCTEALSNVAAYCNAMKLAGRQVKDAMDKLYMWMLLRNAKVYLSEARVLGIGPRFMSIYIQKLAIERRIYYDEVDGLIAEWLESTSTLVLNYVPYRRYTRGANMSRYKALEEVALMDGPGDTAINDSGKSSHLIDYTKGSDAVEIDPAVFPLTIRVLSTIPVALHAVGGDDGPLDIGARLYVTSYFR